MLTWVGIVDGDEVMMDVGNTDKGLRSTRFETSHFAALELGHRSSGSG